MIELTCFKKGEIEKHRRMFLRLDIKSVIEMPDTKEVVVVLRERKGLLRRRVCFYVEESFDEVKALLIKNRG